MAAPENDDDFIVADLSAIDAEDAKSFDPDALGLTGATPFSITLHFDGGRKVCPLCGLRFMPPSDVDLPHASVDGEYLGMVCEACAVEYLTD